MRKILLLLFILTFIECVRAQDTTSYSFSFNHLALSVKDLKASADFYQKVLKLREITNRSKLEGVRWFEIGGGKELHLISFLKEKVITNKAVHLALTTPNFDAFSETLDGLKIQYSDWPGALHDINIRADGIRQVFFQDPDGYWVEVNSVRRE